MKFLHDVCVVKILDEPFYGSLVLPDNRRPEAIVKAKVVQVGAKFRYAKDINVNDTVLVSDYVGARLELNREHVRVYDGEDIIAKVV
jgi:co-chaperonin GroES (HSP10)